MFNIVVSNDIKNSRHKLADIGFGINIYIFRIASYLFRSTFENHKHVLIGISPRSQFCNAWISLITESFDWSVYLVYENKIVFGKFLSASNFVLGYSEKLHILGFFLVYRTVWEFFEFFLYYAANI